MKRENLDQEILENPLNSQNEVKDGRSFAFAGDGLNAWSCKQTGL